MSTTNDFDETTSRLFPGLLGEADFVERTGRLLEPFGFTADNTMACVGTCRDELCVPLRNAIIEQWGEAFNLASLGGMMFAGRTGFHAAHAHAPQVHGRRRHLYVAMPHVGIAADGTVGVCERPGIEGLSAACGALAGFRSALASGVRSFELVLEDIEQSLLQKELAEHLEPEGVPELLELTLLAEQVIRRDLEREIAGTVDVAEIDYAVFTGVQVHGPERRHYVWPRASYAVVEGDRHELALEG